MSQHPIYAAPAEHASKISGITPSNTSQGGSMEPNMEVPNFSDGNKGSHFPFMKLPVGKSTVADTVSEEPELTFIFTPTEIRLEIYPYLLIAVASWPKDVELEKSTSRGVVLAIHRIAGGDGESEIKCERTGGGFSSCPSWYRIGLTPQVLRTCRAVHQEAAPILYCENVFGFSLCNHVEFWHAKPKRQDLWNEAENFCRDIYRNSGKRWDEKGLYSLRTSGFVPFLQQIGPKNAASMKRLKFYYKWSRIAKTQWHGWAIEMNALLLKYHVPGIQQMKICYGSYHDSMDWDDFENGLFEPVEVGMKECLNLRLPWEFFALDPINEVLGQEVICKAIENMVKEVHWLQHLRVTGLDEYDQIRQRIENLQTLVKNRHSTNQAKHPNT